MNRPRPGAPRPKPLPGRTVRPQVAATNPMPLIVGGIAVVLIVILFVVMSGPKKESEPAAAAPPPPPAAPKPVDVSGLETEGLKLCEEGLALIRAQEPNFTKELDEAGRARLKSDLRMGMDKIQKGMSYLSDANEKSGRQYPTTKYSEARKLAAMKWGELK